MPLGYYVRKQVGCHYQSSRMFLVTCVPDHHCVWLVQSYQHHTKKVWLPCCVNLTYIIAVFRNLTKNS